MKKIEFVKPVYNLKDIPKDELPAIVLCGRSNVGKSSFINSMFNTKIAQTSSSPGKTKSLNYYLIDGKFYIVDLPGFGFAKVSKQERDSWRHLIEEYFTVSASVKLALHFIDSRHEPMAPDIELNTFLRTKDIAYVVLLNKSDKLKQSELALAKKNIKKFFPETLMNENCFLYSSVKGTGKKEVARMLASLFQI